jgi:hypothetical protein
MQRSTFRPEIRVASRRELSIRAGSTRGLEEGFLAHRDLLRNTAAPQVMARPEDVANAVAWIVHHLGAPVGLRK